MTSTLILTSITFKKGNQILYGQDFQSHKGCPVGIKFNAKYINEKRIELTAPGFGLSKDYGKGAIYVSVKDLITL